MRSEVLQTISKHRPNDRMPIRRASKSVVGCRGISYTTHLLTLQAGVDGGNFRICAFRSYDLCAALFDPPTRLPDLRLPGFVFIMPSAPNDNRTDVQLVEALNQNDAAAFDVLYFRHRDWVMRLALRFTGHHEDALDVLQETFAYFVRKFPGFELTAALTTFLYPAVRNFSIAARRKRQRSVSDSQDALPLIPETMASEVASHHDLSRVLCALSDFHREILLMRFVDDMTQPEIAIALDVPLGTVKSRLHHAILAIKKSPETIDRLSKE